MVKSCFIPRLVGFDDIGILVGPHTFRNIRITGLMRAIVEQLQKGRKVGNQKKPGETMGKLWFFPENADFTKKRVWFNQQKL